MISSSRPAAPSTLPEGRSENLISGLPIHAKDQLENFIPSKLRQVTETSCYGSPNQLPYPQGWLDELK